MTKPVVRKQATVLQAKMKFKDGAGTPLVQFGFFSELSDENSECFLYRQPIAHQPLTEDRGA